MKARRDSLADVVRCDRVNPHVSGNDFRLSYLDRL